jgi:hypothetical protein
MKYCRYCQQPLAETEKGRWYNEHIHTQCYDAILAQAIAIIVTEQPTHNYSQEMTAGFAEASAVHHS